MYLDDIIEQLEDKKIKFETFYFAYCTKSPKKLEKHYIEKWEKEEEGVKKIIIGQLKRLLNAKVGTKLYVGNFTGNKANVDEVIPTDFDEDKNILVRDILEKITTDSIDEEELRQWFDILAYKYLVADSSRTRLYSMVVFRAEINEAEKRFCFLTLCDLEEEKMDAYYKEGKLNTILLKNVLKELKLTKGALYPYYDEEEKADGIWLFEDQDALYWKDCFECERVLGKKKEADAVWGTLGEICSPDELSTEKVFEITNLIKDKDEIGFNEIIETVQQVGVTLNEEIVANQAWRSRTPNSSYKVKSSNVFSDTSGIKIKKDNKQINCAPKDFSDIIQFEKDGEIFLVLKGREYAKIALSKDQVNIRNVLSWENFKSKIENE